MPDKYTVFCDNLSGMTWCPTLGGGTFEECVDSIQNRGVSQHWIYHIYVLHQEKVPYWGAHPDVYRCVKSVAGSESRGRGRGLEYALTIWEGNWLFTDKMF